MKHGSLFNGIGGFQLAAQWMGWENIFSSEIDDFCNKITKYHFSDCIQHGDIKKTDFSIYRGQIDILTGGFPCQPFSQAGKRKGTDDNRYLWKEMLRAIREVQPKWIVGENVFGIINWNRGMVFNEVQTDLETEGYEVQPYVLPACAVNAPHRRDRVWFIAHHTREGRGERFRQGVDFDKRKVDESGQERGGIRADIRAGDTTTNETATDPRLLGQEERKEQATGIEQCGEGNISSDTKRGSGKREHLNEQRQGEFRGRNSHDAINCWQNFPTQSPICNGDDGIPRKLDAITFPKWRNESIKAGGNAIVPQIAFELFKVIEKIKYTC